MKLLQGLSLFNTIASINAFVPFLDGGKGMPKLYDGWFNEQISKQASTAVSKAIAAGKVRSPYQYLNVSPSIVYAMTLLYIYQLIIFILISYHDRKR